MADYATTRTTNPGETREAFRARVQNKGGSRKMARLRDSKGRFISSKRSSNQRRRKTNRRKNVSRSRSSSRTRKSTTRRRPNVTVGGVKAGDILKIVAGVGVGAFLGGHVERLVNREIASRFPAGRAAQAVAYLLSATGVIVGGEYAQKRLKDLPVRPAYAAAVAPLAWSLAQSIGLAPVNGLTNGLTNGATSAPSAPVDEGMTGGFSGRLPPGMGGGLAVAGAEMAGGLAVLPGPYPGAMTGGQFMPDMRGGFGATL